MTAPTPIVEGRRRTWRQLARRWAVEWPPESTWAGSATAEALQPLRDEYDRLAADLADTRRRLNELARGRAEAERADRDLLAQAIRTGAKDPGSVEVTKIEERVKELERRQDGLMRAMSLIVSDMDRKVAEERAALLADVSERTELAEVAAREAMEAAISAVRHLADQRAHKVWVRDWPGTKSARPVIPVVNGDRIASRARITDLLAAIREALPEPEPQAARPLTFRPQGAGVGLGE